MLPQFSENKAVGSAHFSAFIIPPKTGDARNVFYKNFPVNGRRIVDYFMKIGKTIIQKFSGFHNPVRGAVIPLSGRKRDLKSSQMAAIIFTQTAVKKKRMLINMYGSWVRYKQRAFSAGCPFFCRNRLTDSWRNKKYDVYSKNSD